MLQLWSKKMLSTIWCTFKIIPTPAEAVVTINGEVRNSVTLLEGSEVSWSVSADKHKEQTGSLTLSKDTVIDVVLEEQNDPLYACYTWTNSGLASGAQYIYAKTPLGSDTTIYSTNSSGAAMTGNLASSSSKISAQYTTLLCWWSNISEDSATANSGVWGVISVPCTRYAAGDLYE